MVQLAEARIHQVVAVKNVGIPIIAVLKAIRRGATGGDDPALIDHPTEAVEAGVLVAGVAVRFAGLLDVGQVHTRLRMRALDYGG